MNASCPTADHERSRGCELLDLLGRDGAWPSGEERKIRTLGGSSSSAVRGGVGVGVREGRREVLAHVFFFHTISSPVLDSFPKRKRLFDSYIDD